MGKQKPGVYHLAIPEQPAKPSAAETIASMFATMEEVSFGRDIAPVLFEEFAFQSLDMRLCVAASGEVERAIDIARWAGNTMKCVPQFAPGVNGTMEVCDIIYKRAGWL